MLENMNTSNKLNLLSRLYFQVTSVFATFFVLLLRFQMAGVPEAESNATVTVSETDVEL